MSIRRVVLFVACLGLFACQNSTGIPQEDTVPVSGVATFNGTPLANYTVSFFPIDGRRPAAGVTDDQGNFILGTNATGDGCPPGPCQVAVVWAGPPPVEPGTEVQIEDPRKQPKQPVPVPQKFADPATSGIEIVVPESGLEDHNLEVK